MRLLVFLTLLTAALATSSGSSLAQPSPRMQQVPARQAGEGEGPYRKLVIRGAMVIKGDGSPPIGPMDIVVEGNRITAVRPAGTPGVAMKGNRPPLDAFTKLMRPACG